MDAAELHVMQGNDGEWYVFDNKGRLARYPTEVEAESYRDGFADGYSEGEWGNRNG